MLLAIERMTNQADVNHMQYHTYTRTSLLSLYLFILSINCNKKRSNGSMPFMFPWRADLGAAAKEKVMWLTTNLGCCYTHQYRWRWSSSRGPLPQPHHCHPQPCHQSLQCTGLICVVFLLAPRISGTLKISVQGETVETVGVSKYLDLVKVKYPLNKKNKQKKIKATKCITETWWPFCEVVCTLTCIEYIQ